MRILQIWVCVCVCLWCVCLFFLYISLIQSLYMDYWSRNTTSQVSVETWTSRAIFMNFLVSSMISSGLCLLLTTMTLQLSRFLTGCSKHCNYYTPERGCGEKINNLRTRKTLTTGAVLSYSAGPASSSVHHGANRPPSRTQTVRPTLQTQTWLFLTRSLRQM